MGRYGTPGRVDPSEILYSVLIAPGDLKNDQIAITLITHAERKGMSVLREAASDEEFKSIVKARIKNPDQSFHGVAHVRCGDVQSLRAKESDQQRSSGDRLYYVLDTDIDGLPNHADIFATVPRPHEKNSHKAAWRKDREKLLELMLKEFSTSDQFRNGALLQTD